MPRTSGDFCAQIQIAPRSVPVSAYSRRAQDIAIIDAKHLTGAPPASWVSVLRHDLAKGDFSAWACAHNITLDRSNIHQAADIYAIVHSFISWRCAAADTLRLLNEQNQEHLTIAALGTLHRSAVQAGDAVEFFEYLSVSGCSPALLGTDSARSWLRDLTLEQESSLLKRLSEENLAPLGEELLRGLCRKISVEDAVQVCSSRPDLFCTLIRENPALAGSASIWVKARPRAREAIALVGEIGDDSVDVKQSAARAVLTAYSGDFGAELIESLGREAVWMVLERLEKDGGLHEVQKWRGMLQSRSHDLIEWASETGSRFHYISAILEPGNTDTCQLISSSWRRLTSSHDELLPAQASFGLAVFFSTENWEIAEACFQSVYDSLASGGGDERPWMWLRPHAPPLRWYREWDRCERITYALAQRLASAEICLDKLLDVVWKTAALRTLGDVLGETRELKKYRKHIRKNAKRHKAKDEQLLNVIIERW